MEAKRHQGSTKSETEVGLCQEYLRLIGVPNPVCGVIYNMMDCVYGDLSSRECYSALDEAIVDLQLMIDKPSKFLRGLDMDNIPSFVTQLNEIKIPRHKEFEDIMSCYRRCVEGSCKLTIIKGESGSGKSWISQNVARFIVAQGGIVVTGKFDQMKQAKPFSAIATAFDSFMDVLVRSKHESLWAKVIIDKLQEALGEDGRHLMYVIPRLSFIIDKDASQFAGASSSLPNMSAQNSVQLLHHLFCQFLEVITTNVQVSLTLCLDDVQWADKASIDLLNRLIMQRNNKLFFLGCWRGDEMESDHPFEHMLTNLRRSNIKASTVHLHAVGEDTLNTVMSELLSLSPRLVRPLSRIVRLDVN
jgi:predicted ATPase